MATLSGALVADAADAVKLHAKWKTGDKLTYRQSILQDQDISGAALPQPMKQQMTQQQEYSITATKAREGGGHELDYQMGRMQMQSRMGDQVMIAFDSQKAPKDDGQNPAAPMLRALTGAKFRLLTRADGKVEKVEGVQEFIEKATADSDPMMASMMKQMVSEDTIKHAGIAMSGLPEKPVQVGDKWPVTQEQSLGPLGTLVIRTDYAFTGWESHNGQRCAVLEHTGTISKKGGDASAESGMISAMDGTTKGKTWFDPEAGAELETISKQNIKMKMSMMGQDMAIDMVQSITNRLVEAKR